MIDYKARCEFLQAELEDVLEKLIKTQQVALEAQETAIERRWKLLQLNEEKADSQKP